MIESAEFRGQFQCIVFAIIDPTGTGNFAAFHREIANLDCRPTVVGGDESNSTSKSTIEPALSEHSSSTL